MKTCIILALAATVAAASNPSLKLAGETANDFCKLTKVGSDVVSSCDVKYGTDSISANANAISELKKSSASASSVTTLSTKVDTLATKSSVTTLSTKVDTLATKSSVTTLSTKLDEKVKSLGAEIAADKPKLKLVDNLGTCQLSKGADSSQTPYVRSSCGMSVQGDSFFNGKIGVDGHSDLVAYIKTLDDKIGNINQQLGQAKSDMRMFQHDMLAETWCADKTGWTQDSRVISGNELGYGKLTCTEACNYMGDRLYSKRVNGRYKGRRWDCIDGAVRIAPFFPSRYSFFTSLGDSAGTLSHPDHNSFYWKAGGCGAKLNGNGRTYCCCAARG